MTQGLYSAVSGVRANQTRMNVIANNIANVNTLGFKSSLANFATVFAKTISGGTPPNGLLGGTNPRQVGSGVVVSEIASNWAQGGTQFTGRNTDLMIQGDGFFAVERVDTNNGNASTDFYLTRAGNFTLDSDGNMVTSAGNRLRGSSQVNGNVTATLGRVQVPLEFLVTKSLDANSEVHDILYSPVGTTAGTIAADFNTSFGYDPTDLGADGVSGTADGSDTGEAGWSLSTVTVELRSFSIGSDGSLTATYSNGDQITVRTNQASIQAADAAGDPTLIRREIVHRPYEGGDYAAGNFQTGDNDQGDGDAATVADDGSVANLSGTGMVAQNNARAVFTGGLGDPANWPPGFDPMEGMQMQLQMATVTNPAGLIYEGANNFLQGANSGDISFGTPGNGSRGSLLAGALESSNVDIAGEFTTMMVTQRAIEAASRVIRAQSEVLQTIINNTV